MLRTRVITAIVMLAIFVPSLFFMNQLAWGVLMAALAAVAGWEWGGFMRLVAGKRYLMGGLIGGVCLLMLALNPAMVGAVEPSRLNDAAPLLALACTFWLLVVPFWLRMKWLLGSSLRALATGVLLIVPTWVAIVQLRLPGPGVLLAVMAAVWLADIGAYFFGRLCGRHKLAPSISPGKTWEGAIGGAAVVLAYGLTLRAYFSLDSFPLWAWVLALLLISAISVIGDLFESLLKRQVGLKDSSGVLPGHGGVMDRIDSLTSVLPLAALLALFLEGVGR